MNEEIRECQICVALMEMLKKAMVVIAILKNDNTGSNKTMAERMIDKFEAEYPDAFKNR